MPKDRLPSRPLHDFRITSLAWQIDIEKNHADAGFPPLSADLLKRRFFQLLWFLQSHNLTARTLVTNVQDMALETELRNSDLTDAGFRFVQRYGDRWIGRSRNDLGEAKEYAVLARWYAQALHSASDA